MVSLAAIIYLVARTIPRIDEAAITHQSAKSFLDSIFSKVPLEKIDLIIDNLLEKMLRKFKIVVMKIDNTLTKKLGSFKQSVPGEKDNRPNIFENSNTNAGDGSGQVGENK